MISPPILILLVLTEKISRRIYFISVLEAKFLLNVFSKRTFND